MALAAVVSSRVGTKIFRAAAATTQKITTGIASTRSNRAGPGRFSGSFATGGVGGTNTGPVSASCGGCCPEVMLPSPCMRPRRWNG
ncbi:Uncharacterised protein [Mycobacteroides abscessus subsp. abscessus]|nr:Uncharacterised protein [Mycobacteroides abscessus subsp. abscessus]